MKHIKYYLIKIKEINMIHIKLLVILLEILVEQLQKDHIVIMIILNYIKI
jgi:hypothetical protein